jgi:hypothetical protein
MIPVYSFIFFLACGLTGLILWIKMISILKSKGDEEFNGRITTGQYIRFWRLMKNEIDERTKRKYRLIFWGQVAIIPIYPIGFFLLLLFG